MTNGRKWEIKVIIKTNEEEAYECAACSHWRKNDGDKKREWIYHYILIHVERFYLSIYSWYGNELWEKFVKDNGSTVMTNRPKYTLNHVSSNFNTSIYPRYLGCVYCICPKVGVNKLGFGLCKMNHVWSSLIWGDPTWSSMIGVIGCWIGCLSLSQIG